MHYLKNNIMLKNFIWPFGGLVACSAIVYYMHPPIVAIILAAGAFLACNLWLFISVQTDSDVQWTPAAAAVVVPMVILAISLA